MKPLSKNSLLANTSMALVATPVFFQDSNQDTPTTKPAPKPQDGPKGKTKDKSKGKPKVDRPLGDVEIEALKRIEKIDQALARKLRAKLPKKQTKPEQSDYIRKRLGKIIDERKQIKGMEKAGIFRPDRLKALDKLQKELLDLGVFFTFGQRPRWYIKLLEDRKKAKKTKQPTSKPTKQPAGGSNGLNRTPDGFFLNFVAA